MAAPFRTSDRDRRLLRPSEWEAVGIFAPQGHDPSPEPVTDRPRHYNEARRADSAGIEGGELGAGVGVFVREMALATKPPGRPPGDGGDESLELITRGLGQRDETERAVGQCRRSYRSVPNRVHQRCERPAESELGDGPVARPKIER